MTKIKNAIVGISIFILSGLLVCAGVLFNITQTLPKQTFAFGDKILPCLSSDHPVA